METTVCVAGGGPAGLMLGLLLARAGVDVTVVEKHADFLRDFRGDTVHPSTLQVLHELGLDERFSALPYQKVRKAGTVIDGEEFVIADFGTLRVPFPYVAMVPQWEFLNLLGDEGAAYANFRLLMNAEVDDLIQEAGRVTGVRVRRRSETPEDGTARMMPESDELEVRAGLVVAADGRHSTVRSVAGLRPRDLGSGIDVLYFRLPRREEDADGVVGVRLSPGHACVAVPRPDYWQVAYLIRKGGFDDLRAAGIERLHQGVREVVPMLADRIEHIASWDQVSTLDVRIDRLTRWHRPGLLCIGDAAHAMSPIGGVGVNLAVQDAVAAANLLTEALLERQRNGRPVPERALAAVQRRRLFPAAVTQEFQRLLERMVIRPTLEAGGGQGRSPRPPRRPKPGLVLPLTRPLVSRMVGLGIRPEHVRTPPRSATP